MRSSSRLRLTVSADGYVRLSPAELAAVPLRHLLSELDLEPTELTAMGATRASIRGITEWVSDSRPAVSCGWDWQLDTTGGRPRYLLASSIRSNVMLVDERRRDMPPRLVASVLRAVISDLRWQQAVCDYINDRYSAHLSTLTVTGESAPP